MPKVWFICLDVQRPQIILSNNLAGTFSAGTSSMQINAGEISFKVPTNDAVAGEEVGSFEFKRKDNGRQQGQNLGLDCPGAAERNPLLKHRVRNPNRYRACREIQSTVAVNIQKPKIC